MEKTSVNQIEVLATKLNGVKAGKGWKCFCPCHVDSERSLGIMLTDSGKLSFKCFAGCDSKEIYSKLKEQGLLEPQQQHRITYKTMLVAYEYCDAKSVPVYRKERWSGTTAAGVKCDKLFRLRRREGDGWRYGMGDVAPVLYNLPQLLTSTAPVFVVEGEKDADRLDSLGLLATTAPFGAGTGRTKWPASSSEILKGRKIVVLPDNDKPGMDFAQFVAADLHRHNCEVKLVELPGLAPKQDVSDWLDAGGSKQKLLELVRATPSYTPAENASPLEPDPIPHLEIKHTDLANVERFYIRYGENIRYSRERGWFSWDGKRWLPDADADVSFLVSENAKRILAESKSCENENEAKARHSWAVASQSRSKLDAVVVLSSKHPKLQITMDSFDTDPMLLNCQNGVLDLRNGSLQEHEREMYMSRISPVEYERSTECPMWLKFLTRVTANDTALIDYLQRVAGYCMTGETGEQALFFLYGSGRNGKSVFIEALKYVLGDYAIHTRTEALMAKGTGGSIPNDIARLAGPRLVTCSETQEGGAWNESLLKDLTGGDTLSARFLRREHFDFTPRCKLFVRGNHKPTVRGTDLGIWRRFHLIPFTVQIPEAEVDPHLLSKLRTEAAGILAWCLHGCLAWQAEGLNPPERVRSAVEDYKEESDTLARFISEQCTCGDSYYQCKAGDLYAAYKSWAHAAGEYIKSQTKFSKELKERCEDFSIVCERRSNGVYYVGIAPSLAEDTIENDGVSW